jgi:hypothetical protein
MVAGAVDHDFLAGARWPFPELKTITPRLGGIADREAAEDATLAQATAPARAGAASHLLRNAREFGVSFATQCAAMCNVEEFSDPIHNAVFRLHDESACEDRGSPHGICTIQVQ